MSFTENTLRILRQEVWRRENLIGLRATAERMGIDVRTLRRWHVSGIGPKRQNDEHKRPISYLRAEVEEFAAANRGRGAARPYARRHSERGNKATTANGHPETDQAPTSAIGHLEIK
ncbi:MAG TPA: hypothetical protein VMU69_06110 [Bradyrhizobium sp.]|nr:hypothetical protein [Bradyrhizobium sp.]